MRLHPNSKIPEWKQSHLYQKRLIGILNFRKKDNPVHAEASGTLSAVLRKQLWIHGHPLVFSQEMFHRPGFENYIDFEHLGHDGNILGFGEIVFKCN